MDVRVGDILTMKKAHPCGEKRWQVLRIGADFKLRCLGCGREVMGAPEKPGVLGLTLAAAAFAWRRAWPPLCRRARTGK